MDFITTRNNPLWDQFQISTSRKWGYKEGVKQLLLLLYKVEVNNC